MLSCKQPTYYYYYLVRSYSSYFVFLFYRKSSCITLRPDDGRLEVFRSSMHNHCASIVWYTAVYIYILCSGERISCLWRLHQSQVEAFQTQHTTFVCYGLFCARICVRALFSVVYGVSGGVAGRPAHAIVVSATAGAAAIIDTRKISQIH